tara:strand:- start:3522 stop:5222 length:1701 start_codon:yes stop_codon:yes gene_type:complete
MTEPENGFDELCRRAVTAFLQTVVVIDNEASLVSDASDKTVSPSPVAAARKRATAPGKIAGGESETKAMPEKEREHASDTRGHRLELNKVSQAFAQQGLTCGVYLPTEKDPADQDELVRATARAISPTDACILDWQLKKGDSRPAVAAIKEVLKNDAQEGGRLRLILIYTAEKLEDAAPNLIRALREDGHQITDDYYEEAPIVVGDHFRIIFINKPTLGRTPDDDAAVVPWNLLPQRVISEFTVLSKGLLRAFALQSVAGVRRDMHRILAQFDEELDPVYAGDRATKTDPDDAGRLMIEVLQSELALSIAESQAEQKVLGAESCILWLHSRADRLPADKKISVIKREGSLDDISTLNTEARKLLLTDGFRDVTKADGKHASVSRSFFEDEDSWKRYSSDYAVLTTIAHHSGDRVGRPPSGIPILQFGTVIDDDDQILLCIQPACDTVRLQGETAFLFLRLIPEESKFDLVLPDDDGGARYQIPDGGKFKHLRELKTLRFEPQADTDVIVARQNESGKNYFYDAQGVQWQWRAQLREMTAVHLAQRAINTIGRIGSNEFEWLRTNAK